MVCNFHDKLTISMMSLKRVHIESLPWCWSWRWWWRWRSRRLPRSPCIALPVAVTNSRIHYTALPIRGENHFWCWCQISSSFFLIGRHFRCLYGTFWILSVEFCSVLKFSAGHVLLTSPETGVKYRWRQEPDLATWTFRTDGAAQIRRGIHATYP